MSSRANKSLNVVMKIREAREIKAMSELSRVREQVSKCEEQVAENKNKLEQYYQWRMEFQQNVFAENKDRIMNFSEFSEYQSRVASALQMEPVIIKQIEDAEKELQATVQQMKKAQVSLVQVMRSKEKINELVKYQTQESDAEMAQQEEQESEEYNSRSYKPVKH